MRDELTDPQVPLAQGHEVTHFGQTLDPGSGTEDEEEIVRLQHVDLVPLAELFLEHGSAHQT